jgi:hypothetical protein
MKISLASIARYFLIGIDAGICTDDEARAWSIAVIDAFDFPPGEIIEVSWNKPRSSLREDLNSVVGVADLEQVGRWLLGTLRARYSPDETLWWPQKAALHVVNATGLDESIHYAFDGIGDELALAEQGVWGTVADARGSFQCLLAEFDPPPFLNGWADTIFAADV